MCRENDSTNMSRKFSGPVLSHLIYSFNKGTSRRPGFAAVRYRKWVLLGRRTNSENGDVSGVVLVQRKRGSREIDERQNPPHLTAAAA
jgi:hypothetical protein